MSILTVSQVMSPGVVTISPEETSALAARLLRRHNIGALAVMDDRGHLRGMVTDRDIAMGCAMEENNPAQIRVAQVMHHGVYTAAPEDSVTEALRKMRQFGVHRLCVVEGGRLVGMVSLGDIAARGKADMEAAAALCELSSGVRSPKVRSETAYGRS